MVGNKRLTCNVCHEGSHKGLSLSSCRKLPGEWGNARSRIRLSSLKAV